MHIKNNMKDVKRVFIETLGCSKNQNDSESAMGILEKAGFIKARSPEDADFILVNTCGFIEDAKIESIDKIFQMSERKKNSAKLVVSGCLAQRYAEELFKEIPEADCFIGVNEYGRLPEILNNLESGKRTSKDAIFAGGCDLTYLEKNIRNLSGDMHTATIKIAEGCNNRCTYCVIPEIRGRYRSKREEDIISEAEELAASGCKELVLIAQDVTYYGKDIYGEYRLPKLLRKLEEVDGIEWIRLLYCYDERITDELIEVMAKSRKICHYIDIPLQHASDKVLKEMNRRSTNSSIRKTVERLRNAMPDIAIRTTFIVGFPGENDEDYMELVKLVEDIRFDRLGVFTYSQEEGTPAGERTDQIPHDIKEQRLDGIMMRQMDISFDSNQNKIGKTYEVIVDEVSENTSYIGRTQYDAPEIDNGVIFTSEKKLKTGDIVRVLIEDAFDYDITGRAV